MNKRLWVRFFIGAALGLSLLTPVPAHAQSVIADSSFSAGIATWAFAPSNHWKGKGMVKTGFATGYKGGKFAQYTGVGTVGQQFTLKGVSKSYQLDFWYRPNKLTTAPAHFSVCLYSKSIVPSHLIFGATTNIQNLTWTEKHYITPPMGGKTTYYLVFYGQANSATNFASLDSVSLTPYNGGGPAAPEIDPGSAALPVALTVGSLLLLGDRRPRRPSEVAGRRK